MKQERPYKSRQLVHTSFPLAEVLVEQQRISLPGKDDEVYQANEGEAESKLDFLNSAKHLYH